jgi:23S rRNA (adenine2030-N6)-methyltransferase
MNYRHAFHAGNFADVFKHATLVRILLHLRGKPAPFRVIDTHAGCGIYDLAGPQASRSGEWRDGIARLWSAPRAEGTLLSPYLSVVASLNAADRLTTYPGSSALVRAFLRSQDRLIACELEPRALAELARNLGRDRRCKAIAIDGWTALNAFIPPKERRGVVLIDPPFEDASDFSRLAEALAASHRKWANGTYLLWHPLKQRAGANALARRLRHCGFSKILRAELAMARQADRLHACGLIILNPPWMIEEELRVMLPELVAALSKGDGGSYRVDWLAGEK